MQIITYSPEVQKEAAKVVEAWDAANARAAQARMDEEGCGAVFAAILQEESK